MYISLPLALLMFTLLYFCMDGDAWVTMVLCFCGVGIGMAVFA